MCVLRIMSWLINSFQLAILMQPLLTVLLIVSTIQRTSTEKVFAFPEFDYAESPKNVRGQYFTHCEQQGVKEIAWREWEAACEQTPACLGLVELEKLRCVRKCMSPSCYHDIYSFDELEEGEIDIRFQSFKGCFASRIARKRY